VMSEQLSDTMLLERFVSRREEAAFVAIVERHGPLVQRVCRRILRNEHDIEDVFQATFLVLFRRASAIPWRESVGGWLGAVAHRLALGARSDASRQNRREIPMTTLLGERFSRHAASETELPEKLQPWADPFALFDRREAVHLLKDELLRLPEKYRSPVVLCYLEGRTHEEAALELGCPTGSMSRRLKRAQSILRRRLIHRGFSFAVGLFAALFAVLSVWSICRNQNESAAALRSAMASLKPLTDGAGGIEGVMAGIDGGETNRDRDRILALSRRATEVAEAIEPYEPGKSTAQWRKYLSEMRLSSVLLAQATRENDRSSMRLAARRLNAACLGCHEAFCESARESAAGTDSFGSPVKSSPEPGVQSGVFGLIFRETTLSGSHRFVPESIGAIEFALLEPRR
jgi:RNA polymerase sigma factor (sigma-70 family)